MYGENRINFLFLQIAICYIIIKKLDFFSAFGVFVMIKKTVEISKIDQERFGIKVAKTNQINLDNIQNILSFCK